MRASRAAEPRRQPPLARDEELQLFERAERGDDAALHRLVDAHYGYIVAIARRYRGWGVPMSDLLQEGVVGLMQAVRRFRPDEGVRLSTYAVWWIRSAIQDHALRSWSVVRIGTSNASRALALKIRHIAGEFVGDADSEARIGELASRFGTTTSEIKRLAHRLAAPDISLDPIAQPVAHAAAAGRAMIDRLISDWPTPEQMMAHVGEARFVHQRLTAALAELSERERFVIRERYFSEAKRTFAAIGRQLGVSKDRARQLEAAALKKLAALLGPAMAQESR
jgi:RNA polymerase sigma-32 factor